MWSYLKQSLLALLLFLCWLELWSEQALAQDDPNQPPNPNITISPASTQSTNAEITPDGFTVWKKEINSGCQFSDYNYTLDVDADPNEMSDIMYTMTNYDVDYNDPQTCEAGPEVDHMQLNGSFLGILTGANNAWSTNSWPLDKSKVISGSNQIYIDTDAPGTGCWCVGVGFIEIRAKLGFKVLSFTPQDNDKNRDFHADKLDLTVTFSTRYDPATLTNDTFKLEYRDQAGNWQQVTGAFSQLAPEKFRFTPSTNLKDGVRYRATVKSGDAGVKAANGGKLDKDQEWFFWTVPDLSLTDNFTYGGASVCPPSSAPCPGTELAVFQVARNATMVPKKPAVARLYLRWKLHTDVFADDQTKTLEVDGSITVGGNKVSRRQTVKRPDQYSAAEKQAGTNSLNLKHTPDANFNYSAEVIPQPQTNATVIKYTTALNLTSSGKSPNIKYNYYFLKDGDWAAGAPAAAKTDGRTLFTAGSQFMVDVFPILSATHTEKGDYSIGYTRVSTMTDTFAQCGTVWRVDCPSFLWFSSSKPEIQCVYDKLESMRGGNFFVAATVPAALCPNTNGMAYRHVFVHFSGSAANYGTVVHETGHIYTLNHIDTPNNIEGYQVRTNVNRSFTESPTNLQSLMHTFGQPADQRWIDNSQYNTLIGTVNVANAQAAAQPTAGPYLIVFGYLYTDTNSAEIAPAFLQDTPNDPPSATGSCKVELLDQANAPVASDFVTPGGGFSKLPSDPSAPATETPSSAPFFSVSLPWNESARHLRISCGGNVLYTLARSPNPPTVAFTNVNEGETISGNRLISWDGSDADGPNIGYQLQFSEDNGAQWTPLMPLATDKSFVIDSALLSSGPNRSLRILATDGFNTVYATRTINLLNPLQVISTLPGDATSGAEINTTIQALFASALATTTITPGVFEVIDDNFTLVKGVVTYDAAGRLLVFTPDQPLKANSTYSAQIYSSLTDVNGNPLATDYQWSFTTGDDTSAPYVVNNHPADADLNVPINTLIQVRFSEEMAPATLNTTTFQVVDPANTPLAGTVIYNSETWSALFIPNANLLANSRYTIRLTTGATDDSGNPLSALYQSTFTTGEQATINGFRIVGNYSEQAEDTNTDGLYDLLKIFVDVEVRTKGTYNLNARLADKLGNLIEWATSSDVYLTPGIHRLTLSYNSVPIRSNGVDGSYILESLNFYNINSPLNSERRTRAFQTFPYDVDQFFSILALSNLPDQLLESNTTRDNAFNLRQHTVHVSRPVTDVTYRILINTDPAVGVTIDPATNIDINPLADREAESDVSIEATDPEGNRVVSTFHVSVQNTRPTNLDVRTDLVVGVNQTRPVVIKVFDQFNRPFTRPVTVTLNTTLGTITPVRATTTTGEVTALFAAGGAKGVAFINAQTDAGSTLVRVEVVEVAVNSLQISGPVTGLAGTAYDFSAAIGPVSTTLPISISWRATGQTPIILPSNELSSSASFTWNGAGRQILTVVATNGAGAFTATHAIDIALPQGSLNGHVFVDRNRNGVQDSGEPNAAAVTVSATAVGGGTPVITTTDGNGDYLFANLPIGQYTVTIFAPNGATFTTTNVFTVAVVVSNTTIANVGFVYHLNLPLIRR
jgi:hypothetical protein